LLCLTDADSAANSINDAAEFNQHSIAVRLTTRPRFSAMKRIADLAKQVQAGKAADTPEKLNTKRALCNNLNKNEALALKIDKTVRRVRPNAFRGNQAKENVIKAALLPLLGNDERKWSAFS